MMLSPDKILCILYSSGGTADVGRHAVRAALDACQNQFRILTADPATLEEKNWKCACGPHHFTDEERKRMDVRKVDFTNDDFHGHLENVGAVVSALGNRQPFYGDNVGAKGTQKLVEAMEQREDLKRVVAVTSAGCNEDWPPMEFHWAGDALKWILRTVSRRGWKDLEGAERALKGSSLNYLIVRPVGLGEDRPPKGEWFVQKEKYKDNLGPDMAKLDCACFAVSEALKPTYHKRAVVVGSDFDTFEMNPKPQADSASK
jgi:hypothetical protein